MFTLAPKTPHARLRNENSTQFGGNKAFPKTPLPSAKQIIGKLMSPYHHLVLTQVADSSQSGKPVTGAATHLRKALLDKTPGTHLQNRGLKFAVQTPSGKTTVFIDQKPPSASRKSVKKPRVSTNFKTPNPATQKPHWDVDEAEVSQETILQEEKEDDDEPEYMPPPVSIPAIETEYEFRSGAELGKLLNDMAHIPYHLYDDTPISFEEEAFFISDDLLTVPLGILPDEPLPFLSDDEDMSTSITPPLAAKSIHTPVVASSVRSYASRRPPQPIAGTRAKARTTVATSKRVPISPPAIPARRKSATTSALRTPLRAASVPTASAMGRSTRAVTRPRTGAGVTPTIARAPPKVMVPRPQVGAVKGKGRAPPVAGAGAGVLDPDDPLGHLPPALREVLERNEPVFEDFRFDV